MFLFKCKMCGGAFEINNQESVAVCEYCGTQQTIPRLDNERRANLYDRANHFRRNNDYNKAMGIYEQILNEDSTDAEAYWSLVLCRYGIEYVEDPVSHKRIPTINRAQFTSIFDDDDYKSALLYADSYQKLVYEAEAKEINEVQKGILAISQKEDPFDVFICYKETDNNGRRTQDSVLAQDLYYLLTQEGFKVFFSRITLEDKLGSAYEPYIFAALNSAKVMVVLGTRPEHFHAVWVKNEWSRYLALIKNGAKKILIPAYRDMDPYDLPEEFSHLQAQDMSKLGFMQDIVRGIKKIAGENAKKTTVIRETVVTNPITNTAPLLKRVFLFLEDGDWASADEYCEKVLDLDPECPEAYLGKLMVELHVKKQDELKDQPHPFDGSNSYQKVLRFGDDAIKNSLEECIKYIIARNEQARLDEIYTRATNIMDTASNEKAYRGAAQIFSTIREYKDAAELEKLCIDKADEMPKEIIYVQALRTSKHQNEHSQREAARLFASISSYKDAAKLAQECQETATSISNDEKLYKSKQLMAHKNIQSYKEACQLLESISGWKDADMLWFYCNENIEKIIAKREEIRLENERKAAEERENARKRAQRKKRITFFVLFFILISIAVIALWVEIVLPKMQYNIANDLFSQGKYEEAIDAFEAVGDFQDSHEKALECRYHLALSWMADGDLSSAKCFFEEQSDYKNSSGMLDVIAGLELLSDLDYTGAIQSILQGNVGVQVHYNTNSEQELESVEYMAADQFIGLTIPENTGYKFAGWSNAVWSYTPEGIVEIWLDATWTDDFIITYILNGGEGANPTKYKKGGDGIILAHPTREGYTFDGWTGTDLPDKTMWVAIPEDSYGDREYTAHWKANEYTFTLDANGGFVETTEMSVSYQTAYTLPEPTRDHYTFLGWYSGVDKYEDGTLETPENITLVAIWEPVTYRIEYIIPDGGTNPSDNVKEYTVESPEVVLREATKLGYRFAGWYSDSAYQHKVTSITSGSHGDVTLYAKWEKVTYTITYHLNSGTNSSQNATSYNIGSSKIVLQDPARAGYKFLGWYKDSGYKTKVTEIATGSCGDLNLYAKWEAIRYTITYKLDGGSNSSKNPSSYTIDDQVTLQSPSKLGHSFKGWYSDSSFKTKVSQIAKGNQKNFTLYAKWEKVTYTITYHLNGGTNSSQNATSYNIGSSKIVLQDPTRAGYKFLGWYKDSGYKTKVTEIATGSCGDLNLYAKWEAISYTITYKLDGGSNSSKNPSSYTIDDQVTLQSPTKAGYSFKGWYSDSGFKTKVTQIPKGTQKNFTLYAKWEIITYTITYNLNGGTVSGTLKETFTVNDLPLSLPTPTKRDYVFLGWKVGTFDGTDITSITKTENITIFAAFMDSYLQLEKYVPYSWSKEEPYYIVKKYSGSATVVDIPAKYEGYPVKEIGSSAFSGNTTVATINIPSSVEEIGSRAFSGCSAITQIEIPNSVITIGYSAFYNCTSLRTMQLPDSVTSIGSSAFAGCTSMASVHLPKKLTSLGNGAFENCTSLQEIDIPGSLEEIDYCTFSGCTNLTTVTLNEGLKEISFGAFGSEKITTLVIPLSVTYIHDSAFSYYSYGTCSNVVFLCRAAAMPSGWNAGWNIGRPIVWGYDESTYKAPTYSFVTNGGTKVASQTVISLAAAPVSTKSGYVLAGWYDNPNFLGEPVTFPYYNASSITLYAMWMLESEYYNGSSMERAYRIAVGSSNEVTFTTKGQKIYYSFAASQTKTYTITSGTGHVSCYVYLYDENGTQLAYDYVYSSWDEINISYELIAGRTYYIMIKPYYSSSVPTGSTTFTVQET